MTTAAERSDHSRSLLREMLRIRRFEEKCAELYSAGKIRGFLHLYIGEEAVAVGVMQALTPEDAIVATYREHGHALARGISANRLMAEMFGKQEGCSRGRGGSMHVFDAAARFYGGNAIVAGGLPSRSASRWPTHWLGRPRVTACFFGDGAVAEGEFHESLNLAALWKLPVLFVCENNLYAMGTRIERRTVTARPAAAGARVRDGRATRSTEWMSWPSRRRRRTAVAQRADAAMVPTFSSAGPTASARIRCSTPSCIATRPKSKSGRSAIRSRAHCATAARGLLDDAACAALDAEVQQEIAAAVAFAEAGTWEPVEQLTRDVYTPRRRRNVMSAATSYTARTYREAIRQARA